MNNKDISVDKVVQICESTVLSRGTSYTVNSFCCDTRLLKKGDIFVSFKSEAGDEIKYIKEAFSKGAIGCITECDIPKEIVEQNTDKLIIKVRNAVKAIQELAKYKRSLLNIPVVAITGSVGKTSTKDMVANVIAEKYNVTKTEGNYNNHIGVPLTILSWNENTEVAVVEMGMNHFGEISVLTNIAKPTVAIITNIGTAHIGLLGSRENILKAKLEILEGLGKNGKVILNNDNDLLHNCEIKDYKKITYGINNTSDFVAENIVRNENNSQFTINLKNKEYRVNVPLAGEHFIYNSLCAIAVATELGIEPEKIIEGINTVKLTGKRNEIIETNNLKIINDYYNASYDSMKASLGVLAGMKASRKVAILGDMLELGEYTEELHKKVGEEVAKNNIDILITVGNLTKFIAQEAKSLGVKRVYEFENNKECLEKIKEIIEPGDTILLKASNLMNLGEISKYLQA